MLNRDESSARFHDCFSDCLNEIRSLTVMSVMPSSLSMFASHSLAIALKRAVGTLLLLSLSSPTVVTNLIALRFFYIVHCHDI